MRRRRVVALLAFVACGLVFLAAGSAPAASGGGVSAAFQPFAASFLSPSIGFVLGGVGCQFGANGPQRPCKPLVMTTSNGGLTWRSASSPPTKLQPVGGAGLADSLVRAITFADPRDGWLFGPGLWATHDGGAHWTQIAVKAQVYAVDASGGWAYATTSPTPGASRGALLRSPVGRDDWQPVGSLAETVSPLVPLLATSGRSAWIGVLPPDYTAASIPALWRTTDGLHWQRIGNPCGGSKQTLVTIDATSPADLVMTCSSAGTRDEIVTSSDGGIHTRQVAQTPAGYFGVVAAPPGQSKVIVLATPPNAPLPANLLGSVRSVLDRTSNGGKTWTSTTYGDHGVGWADLQFVSPTVAWVVYGFPGASTDELMQATNEAASFKPVRF